MAYISTTTVNGQVYQIRDATLVPVESGSSIPGLMTGADKSKLDNLRDITISTLPPTTLDGRDGDIWITYTE